MAIGSTALAHFSFMSVKYSVAELKARYDRNNLAWQFRATSRVATAEPAIAVADVHG